MSDDLAGRAVLITRPAGEQTGLINAVRQRGGIALWQAGIQLSAAREEPSLSHLHQLTDNDIAIFTSPAAVRFGLQYWPPSRWPKATQVIGAGQRTCHLLKQMGLEQAQAPRTEGSEGMLAQLATLGTAGRRVYVVGAHGGRRLLHTHLAASGVEVAAVYVYQRDPPTLNADMVEAIGQYWASLIVTATSAAILRNVTALLNRQLARALEQRPVCVASQRIDQCARELGFKQIQLALGAADGHMLEAVVAAAHAW